MSSSSSRALRLYSLFFVAAILFLISFGALVTSNNAGLSVPDWPTTYGQNMFSFPYQKWVGGIFFEHSHRLIAACVGILTIILAVWIAIVEPRHWVKVLAFSALAAVIIQGLLGGLTVLLRLPDSVSVAHAMVGQTFLLLAVWIAYSYTFSASDTEKERRDHIFLSAVLCVVILYVQLLIGAWMRHSDAGLAFIDFPKMAGSFSPFVSQETLQKTNAARAAFHLPPVNYVQATVHIAHRYWSIIVSFALVWLIQKMFKVDGLRSHAVALSLLLIAQLTLGMLTVLSLRNPLIASAHVLCGAGLLALTFLAALRTKINKGVAT
jgi:cytochrome c oxidase assembly protein subunit 15